jgi:hypothetical protein
MSIQSKITEINTKLKDAKLNTSVTIIKKGFAFSKKDGLQVLVNDVPEANQIDVSAQIQTILRASLGYGTLKTKYDINSNQLGLEYVPIANARVASTRSDYIRQEHRTYQPTGTPGRTDV